MSNYFDALNLPLSDNNASARARNALLRQTPWTPASSTRVRYHAGTRLLIIGNLTLAQRLEKILSPREIQCFIVAPASTRKAALTANCIRHSAISVEGFLGSFLATTQASTAGATHEPENLAAQFGIRSGVFDQVLDLGRSPLIASSLRPPGYHVLSTNQRTNLEPIADEISALVGEFEKPKFFHYVADLCAHGANGMQGCTRCIDACPADAIHSDGDHIDVNAHLCQGGGTCASVCPSGAIQYAYPPAEDQLELLRQLIGALRKASPENGLNLLVFDDENGRALVEQHAGQLPAHILPFVVEEIGSVGLDLIAGALAYGVNQVIVLTTESTPPEARRTLTAHQRLLDSLLDAPNRGELALISTLTSLITSSPPPPVAEVATFAAIGGKRDTTYSALSFLLTQTRATTEPIPLPADAMFGAVKVDKERCTLCSACASACPAKALTSSNESPLLGFIEANCVQCGLCEKICPEDAIVRLPRFNPDQAATRKSVVLKQDEPFLCISCHKPFGNASVIRQMQTRLKNHSMFDSADALRRLKMCEDCRVRDLFNAQS